MTLRDSIRVIRQPLRVITKPFMVIRQTLMTISKPFRGIRETVRVIRQPLRTIETSIRVIEMDNLQAFSMYFSFLIESPLGLVLLSSAYQRLLPNQCVLYR